MGWLGRLERRQGTFLTGKAHKELHVDADERLTEDLEEIKQALRLQNQETVKHRLTVQRQLAAISQKVAVIEERISGRQQAPGRHN